MQRGCRASLLDKQALQGAAVARAEVVAAATGTAAAAEVGEGGPTADGPWPSEGLVGLGGGWKSGRQLCEWASELRERLKLHEPLEPLEVLRSLSMATLEPASQPSSPPPTTFSGCIASKGHAASPPCGWAGMGAKPAAEPADRPDLNESSGGAGKGRLSARLEVGARRAARSGAEERGAILIPASEDRVRLKSCGSGGSDTCSGRRRSG